MSLNILCSGYLIRYPVGGFSWHHLQYLVGLKRLGHKVTYFEHYGWPNSCFDPKKNIMTSDASFGLDYVDKLLGRYGLNDRWCYLDEGGFAHGISRERLSQICRDADIYFNLSNINWIPELEQIPRRVLVDTDPVFTQIGAHGAGGAFENYHVLFTYGENVHKPGCEMPSGGAQWLPTRQPVVLDLWPVEAGDSFAPFTTVTSWSPLGEKTYNGHVYGMKDRQFDPFFSLPRNAGAPMELALKAPEAVRQQLIEGGWNVIDPLTVTADVCTYQRYIRTSRAEFSVAKHGYVISRCGWFSERSTCYLASGRPVVVQDTGFSSWLETGAGVIAFGNVEDAKCAIEGINSNYAFHCKAAREIAEEYFDARRVLIDLLRCSLQTNTATSIAKNNA